MDVPLPTRWKWFLWPLLAGCGQGPSGDATGPAGAESPSAPGGTLPASSGEPDPPGLAPADSDPAAGGPSAGPGATTTPSTGSSATPPADPSSGEPIPGDTAEHCATLGEGTHVGVTRLRRLTQAQFDNTVRDLIGATGNPASAFGLDEHVGPFQSNAIASITPLQVQQHEEVASALAQEAVARIVEISPCDLGEGAACIAEFVSDFGRRAHRRPLSSEEQNEYEALFAVGAAEGGVEGGFQLVLEVMLQSPFFVYHVDTGATGAPSGTPTALTSHELASRLSYFLWNTMPDDTLFTLAEQDALQDDAVLREQVARMLADPKAKDAIPFFHLQLLDLVELSGITKDPELFPAFDTALAGAMIAETVDFTDYVVRSGDGLMSTLFQADFGFPRDGLFSLYGVAEPAGFTPGTPVTMPSDQRRGLLTQAAFLSRHAHPNQTSPVHRGLLVRENLLCQPVNSPPPDVDNVPPEPTAATTTRERFANHSLDPSCAVCHQLMDPIGLTFEHYDPIGAYRSEDGLSAVDASGEILGAGDALAGGFYGALELADKLATSHEVATCMSNQWFRFALGRMEAPDDACSLANVQQRFASSSYDVRGLIADIATSEAFRNVRHHEGSP